MIFSLKKTLTAILIALLLSTPAFADWDPNDVKKAQETVAAFKKSDPDMAAFFSKARGYSVYPSVGTAGLGMGGARG